MVHLPSDLANPMVLDGGAQRCPLQFKPSLVGKDGDSTLGRGTVLCDAGRGTNTRLQLSVLVGPKQIAKYKKNVETKNSS